MFTAKAVVVPLERHAVESIVLPSPTPYVVEMEVLLVTLQRHVVEITVVALGRHAIKVDAIGGLVQHELKLRNWPDFNHTAVKSRRGWLKKKQFGHFSLS